MKPKHHWLNSIALFTAAAIAWGTPANSQEANPNQLADANQTPGAVQLYVPPPTGANDPLRKVNGSTATNTIPNSQSIELYVPPAEKPNLGSCSAYLQPAIESIIQRSAFKGSKWGILVESLNDGTVIYAYNANQPFIPASNVKILTTAAALQKLPPQSPIRSTSLSQWVQVTNLRSNNAYAEALLRHIGGSQSARQALTQLGVDPNSYRMADGSGLSRQNLATPKALVDTLRAMYFTSARETFSASLPVAGVSGTLRSRMRSTPAQGTVLAKTGTLRGVRALSGYLNNSYHGTMVFSILANQSGYSGQALTKGIDDIVVQLSTLASCQ